MTKKADKDAPEIVQNGTTVLREKAADVPLSEIGSPKIKKVIADMKAALDSQDDGAAIAAPQIGVPLRIFLISERVFGPDGKPENASKDPHFVFINPSILKLSKKRELMDEGCLSVRGVYGNVPRHNRATVAAYDENGKRFTRGAGGLLAQVFQHEVDHLEGMLFIDRAIELWEVTKDEREAAE
jgi:peptide deformylase